MNRNDGLLQNTKHISLSKFIYQKIIKSYILQLTYLSRNALNNAFVTPFQVLRADVFNQDPQTLRYRGHGLQRSLVILLLGGLRLHVHRVEQDRRQVQLRQLKHHRSHLLCFLLHFLMGKITKKHNQG